MYPNDGYTSGDSHGPPKRSIEFDAPDDGVVALGNI